VQLALLSRLSPHVETNDDQCGIEGFCCTVHGVADDACRMVHANMSVLRLYPAPQEQRPIQGLYLELNLHRQAAAGEVLIYSNYIASMDGRISLRDAASGEFVVPASIANGRDWRLYQELAAQSDVMITSARYFRQLARGRAQDLLPIGREPAYRDLVAWRCAQGLEPQPAVAIVSASLDIPARALDMVHDRDIYVFTTECADPAWEKALKARGAHLVHAGGGEYVEGGALKRRLANLGFHSACMIAGPQVHATLIGERALDRLFLTMHGSLLGGSEYHTILQGDLAAPVRLELESLYLDAGPAGQQMFAQFILPVPQASPESDPRPG